MSNAGFTHFILLFDQEMNKLCIKNKQTDDRYVSFLCELKQNCHQIHQFLKIWKWILISWEIHSSLIFLGCWIHQKFSDADHATFQMELISAKARSSRKPFLVGVMGQCNYGRKSFHIMIILNCTDLVPVCVKWHFLHLILAEDKTKEHNCSYETEISTENCSLSIIWT